MYVSPAFLAAGHRVVAPDIPGFGKSDKPTEVAQHTFAWHRTVLLELVERLDLQRVNLAVQDWGGLLGLTLPAAALGRYRGLMMMNTFLSRQAARFWASEWTGRSMMAIGEQDPYSVRHSWNSCGSGFAVARRPCALHKADISCSSMARQSLSKRCGFWGDCESCAQLLKDCFFEGVPNASGRSLGDGTP